MTEATTLKDVKNKIRAHLPELRAEYGIVSLKIFGSTVHGNQHSQSDIDLLVEFEENSALTLLEFIALEREIGLIVGRKVDLVEEKALKPAIGQRILAEAEAI